MKKLFYVIAFSAVAGFVLSSCTNELETVKIDGKWGFANTAKKVVIPCQYDDVRVFSEGFATVKHDGKWGVINTKGDVVVPCKYDDAYCFSNGFAKVKKDGKYGFINIKGELVIPCQYDEANEFSEGKAKVKKGDIWGYVDKKGLDTFRGPAYEQELQKIAEKKRKAEEEERRKREEEERKRREEEQRRQNELLGWLQGNWVARTPYGEVRVGIHKNIISVWTNGEQFYTGPYDIEGNELKYKRQNGFATYLIIDYYGHRLKVDDNTPMHKY